MKHLLTLINPLVVDVNLYGPTATLSGTVRDSSGGVCRAPRSRSRIRALVLPAPRTLTATTGTA
jgi:hypothetical protein